MNKPYTYYLYHIPTGKKYYGVRCANETIPEVDLWNKYFSSSKKVKLLIEQYGKDSFRVEVRKIFDTKEEAYLWEAAVIKRIKAVRREDWLNQANSVGPYYFHGNGKNNPMYGRTIYDVWLEKYGKEEADLKENIRKEKLSVAFSGKNHPNYNTSRSEKTKIAISKNHANINGENNPMYGKKHTIDSIHKNRKSNQKLTGKPCKCNETGIEYPGIRDAARECKLDRQRLSRHLRKNLPSSINGYTFSYITKNVS